MNETEHLLTCLSEECLEVAKDVSKALRFGLEDRNVLDPTGPTNRERIIAELNDLMGVISILTNRGIIPSDWQNKEQQTAKYEKVLKFMGYARMVEALV